MNQSLSKQKIGYKSVDTPCDFLSKKTSEKNMQNNNKIGLKINIKKAQNTLNQYNAYQLNNSVTLRQAKRKGSIKQKDIKQSNQNTQRVRNFSNHVVSNNTVADFSECLNTAQMILQEDKNKQNNKRGQSQEDKDLQFYQNLHFKSINLNDMEVIEDIFPTKKNVKRVYNDMYPIAESANDIGDPVNFENEFIPKQKPKIKKHSISNYQSQNQTFGNSIQNQFQYKKQNTYQLQLISKNQNNQQQQQQQQQHLNEFWFQKSPRSFLDTTINNISNTNLNEEESLESGTPTFSSRPQVFYPPRQQNNNNKISFQNDRSSSTKNSKSKQFQYQNETEEIIQLGKNNHSHEEELFEQMEIKLPLICDKKKNYNNNSLMIVSNINNSNPVSQRENHFQRKHIQTVRQSSNNQNIYKQIINSSNNINNNNNNNNNNNSNNYQPEGLPSISQKIDRVKISTIFGEDQFKIAKQFC